jgi:hypothetical protein
LNVVPVIPFALGLAGRGRRWRSIKRRDVLVSQKMLLMYVSRTYPTLNTTSLKRNVTIFTLIGLISPLNIVYTGPIIT